jgi:hypothetical protein
MSRHYYPSIKQLAAALRSIKPSKGDVEDDYVDVRLQVVPGEGWALHEGDPQYDTDHRGYWGCGSICPRTNCRTLARELIEETKDDQASDAWCEHNNVLCDPETGVQLLQQHSVQRTATNDNPTTTRPADYCF